MIISVGYFVRIEGQVSQSFILNVSKRDVGRFFTE